MPVNKYALLRYRIIDRCLNNKRYSFPNKEDLRQACEDSLYGSSGEHISESTIDKDLWAMRNETELAYFAPIKYDKAAKGYYYEDENYTINDISLNDEDIDAIKFAATTLYQFREIPIFQQYENAIEKIINRISISPELEDVDLNKYVQFESSQGSVESDYLSQLLQAIKNKKQLSISYKKFQDSTVKGYTIDPYLLKEYRNRWYLIAWNEERKSFLTFGVERLDSIEVLENSFDYKINFDADRFFKHSIGITEIEDTPKKVVLEFSKLQGKYVQSQAIHHSQKVLSEGDKIVISLFVLETYELINLILSYGKDVTVKEPQSLRDKIKSIYQTAIENHS